jgi:hypothetical protein
MPGLENTHLRTNIVIHIFLVIGIFCETKTILNYVFFTNQIVCLRSDSNTELLNQNYGEQ